LFADVLTNQILAELPLTGVNFSQVLNGSGALQGSVLLTGLSDADNAATATVPGRNAVYVERNGVIVWGGVIWFRSYESNNQHIALSCSEFESYFNRRRITITREFENVDQLTIAQTLMSDAQSVANGNLGIVIPTNTSGVLISRTYYPYEQKTVLSAIQDLSKAGTGIPAQTGFDFSIDCAYDSDYNIVKTLNLGYPRYGTAYSSTSTTVPVFEFPAGNVVEYAYNEDGSLLANTVYATGAGYNEGKLIYSASNSTVLAQGWPLLEDVSSYTDITDPVVVQNLAVGQVAAVSLPPTTLKIVVNPSIDPLLETYKVGDDARVRIADARFPNGLDTVYRIIATNVTPGENRAERATLTLSLPTSTVS
jgi:hypothetical protein